MNQLEEPATHDMAPVLNIEIVVSQFVGETTFYDGSTTQFASASVGVASGRVVVFAVSLNADAYISRLFGTSAVKKILLRNSKFGIFII